MGSGQWAVGGGQWAVPVGKKRMSNVEQGMSKEEVRGRGNVGGVSLKGRPVDAGAPVGECGSRDGQQRTRWQVGKAFSAIGAAR